MSDQKVTEKRDSKTERRIKQAYLSLLEKKPKEKITVVDICKEVDINRGTFYYHFCDAYDVLERIISDLAEEWMDFIETSTLSEQRQAISNISIKKQLSDDTLHRLIAAGLESDFFARIEHFGAKFAKKIICENYEIQENYGEFLANFVIGGTLAAEKLWLKKGLSNFEQENDFINSIVEGIIGSLLPADKT